MSDRLAVFNKGRIEQLGTPAEVYERPATRFVAGFVGTSNLLTGDAAEAILGEPDVHDPARRRSTSANRTTPVGPDETSARSGRSATSSTWAPTRATSSSWTPARGSS